MLNENKNESCICQIRLQPTPTNTVVIESMTFLKESESCSDTDATIKCDDKVKNLRTKLEVMASSIITNKKRASLKKVLSDTLYDKVKIRTRGNCNTRWAIPDADATGHFVIGRRPSCQYQTHNQSYPDHITRWTDHHVHTHV